MFKRTDLKVKAILRKYFIPIEKPSTRDEASTKPLGVEVTQTSGDMYIKLNGRVLPKPVVKEIDALVKKVGVKLRYIN